MKTAAVYVRVSTEEQKKHGVSVDNQIDALKEYCKDNDYQIYEIYNDAGISARKSYKKRPALLQLIDDCKDHHIDIILFTKLDRWFRSVADYYEVQSQLDKYNVPWRAIWEDYETETSSGVFKVNIMLSVAQSEADRTSERLKATNEYRKAQGIYTSGKVPIGYIVQKGVVSKDPMKEDGVNAFFETYRKTSNVPLAMLEARKHDLVFTRQTGTRMLKNSAYTGESHGATFEPYISVEQYTSNLRSVTERKSRKPKDIKHQYLFSGLLRCSCCGGSSAGKTRYLQSGKNVRPYKYYICSHFVNMMCDNKHSFSEKKLEKFLYDNIENLIEAYNLSSSTDGNDAVDYSNEIRMLEAKLNRIGDRYEDGDITRDEYKKKRNALKKEITELRFKAIPKKETKTLPADWKIIYSQLDDLHKKEFWSQIITRIEFTENADFTVFFD